MGQVGLPLQPPVDIAPMPYASNRHALLRVINLIDRRIRADSPAPTDRAGH